LQFNLHFLFKQVDAHVGGVNDLAFAHPNKQLCIVTCGDDKLIKVHKIYFAIFGLCKNYHFFLIKILIGMGFKWTQTVQL